MDIVSTSVVNALPPFMLLPISTESSVNLCSTRSFSAVSFLRSFFLSDTSFSYRRLGKAYRAEVTRYSQKPAWTWNNWILDPKLSGGCPIDMHIHDVDLINWFFGKPASLRSAITEKKAELESVFTQMFYDDLLVIANADWSMTQTFPFEARCLVNFETATVILENGKITVYKDDESFSPEISQNDYFTEEIETLLKLVIDDEPTDITSPESVMSSVEIALAEIKSAKEKKEIIL